MTDLAAYQELIRAKVPVAQSCGRQLGLDEMHPGLSDHARLMVQWAVRGGRRAIFASFGLHKTRAQLEIACLTVKHVSGGRALCVMPLGVRQEFMRDAAALDIDTRFIRTSAEVEAAEAAGFNGPRRVFLTNWESVREGKIDPRLFQAVTCDEADVLRSFGSKTFSEVVITGGWSGVPYRFVLSATPDPNDYLELLGYAQFLGVMKIADAKTRFFRRNAEKADHLTLHPHMVDAFWEWVASWALIVQRPSDLGCSDEGYELPELDIRWHELPSDLTGADPDRVGQGRLFRRRAVGVTGAAREKRASLPARVAKLLELRAEDPDAHRILWHDLEDERRALERAIPGLAAVYGNQPLDEREALVRGFAEGEIPELAGKPVMLGAGCNLQRHCHHAIFLGIGFKFRDVIQAIHRLHRFLQPHRVRIDFIYTEAERLIREDLEAKWKRHDEQTARVSALIRERGLTELSMAQTAARTIELEPQVVENDRYRLVCGDCVEETARMASDSVGLVLTSPPFSSQYRYSENLRDFGHSQDAEAFWRQMDFLSPELLRVLLPGRNLVVHLKDRVQPGEMNGYGFQTVQPFHAEAIFHFLRHGFAFLGQITVTTDVVRENNATYRLGWTEQCKDGSRMGAGLPEYLLVFRKPPTDSADGYADVPVAKGKAEYPRARWQLDAHGYWRSNGDRLLAPEDLVGKSMRSVYRLFRAHSATQVYDYEHHVDCGAALEATGALRPDFMVLPPVSPHPDVWSDVARMRTLNAAQVLAGRVKHLCPLQLDIVTRVIRQRSMPGEVVFDPFGGIFTVPHVAVKLGRFGVACELSPAYFGDGVRHVDGAAQALSLPTLFGLLDAESESEEGADVVSDAWGPAMATSCAGDIDHGGMA